MPGPQEAHAGAAGGSPRSPPGPSAIVIAIRGRVEPRDAARLAGRLARIVDRSGGRLILCDIGGLVGADLDVLDTLGRLQLTALRHGAQVRLIRCRPELRALADLTGLSEVLALHRPSAVQMGWQAEQREEGLRIQEEGDAGDGPL